MVFGTTGAHPASGAGAGVFRIMPYSTRRHRDRAGGWCLARKFWRSDLLGGSVGAPVVVKGHFAAHHRVLLPLRRALGESELRLQDFLEQRIFRRLLLDDL